YGVYVGQNSFLDCGSFDGASGRHVPALFIDSISIGIAVMAEHGSIAWVNGVQATNTRSGLICSHNSSCMFNDANVSGIDSTEGIGIQATQSAEVWALRSSTSSFRDGLSARHNSEIYADGNGV